MSLQSFKIIKLYFKTALHISKGKNGSYESSESVLHSDTLKSAIYVSLRQLYRDENIFKTFMDDVVLSSAFPFVDVGDTQGYWLPRPLTYRSIHETPENRKEYKKVNYVTTSQMSHILRGKHPTDLVKNGKANQPNIWKRDTTQRVKINYDDDSEPFYLEKMYPHDKANSGLYFIIQENGFDNSKLKAALKLLGDNGIGLQRGLGNGQFSFKEDSFEIDLPQGQSWVSLSIFRPKKDSIISFLDKSDYQFIKRGGWISSPEDEQFLSIRKKSIMMFTEGSVFAFGDKPVEGVVENIRPLWNDNDLHPIFRDGKAIFLPMKIK